MQVLIDSEVETMPPKVEVNPQEIGHSHYTVRYVLQINTGQGKAWA